MKEWKGGDVELTDETRYPSRENDLHVSRSFHAKVAYTGGMQVYAVVRSHCCAPRNGKVSLKSLIPG